jgi:hypothetical protein
VNPSWIEGPPPHKGTGCFGKGCLVLVAFVVFLGIAFTGGTFLALRFLRTSYLSATPAPLPTSSASEDEQEAVRALWHDFETAARAGKHRRIEMTADQLNALIASEPKLRGKAFVTINDDTARLQISWSLQDMRLLRGRYMNVECTVQSAPDGDPGNARLTNILVNSKPVGEDTLNWRGPWGFRRYLEQWTDEERIRTFQIADGKVILESRGGESF